MKNKTYYEILGVAHHVGSGQIQAAYRFARSLYVGDSTPTYGLLDGAERGQMLDLVEEAYSTLSNPNARREYDAGLNVRESPKDARPENDRTDRSARQEKRATPRSVGPAPLPSSMEAVILPLAVPELVNGGVLKSLREQRNLSVDQIAALSKVGSRFLKALEEDRHEALPGRVFARGFLIEYARAIHVSEIEIVERYLRHWTAK